MELTKFTIEYKKNLINLIEEIEPTIIENIVKNIENIEKNGNKIYIIGNGGSASTASHMVNDLGIGLKRRNIKNLNIESLSDNIAVCTALGNDLGFENIFYEQILNKIKKEDLLIAISCSGESPNILKAVRYAKGLETKVISLTGFNGGQLKGLADISYHINTEPGEYGIVEDLHLILNHLIYSYFIKKGN